LRQSYKGIVETKTAIVERGYRGKNKIGEIKICLSKPIKNTTTYQKSKNTVQSKS